jgi:hypothetical protein
MDKPNPASFKSFVSSIKDKDNVILLEAIITAFKILFESDNGEFPKAPSIVSGLEVRKEVPNTDSIPASLTDYKVLPGIREVPMNLFNAKPTDLFYAKNDIEWSKELAEKIKESKEINPLIVVIDKEGPYILEGGHRMAALYLLGAKTFPAMVVMDLDD